MNIILVSNHLTKARTLTITLPQLVFAGLFAFLVMFAFAGGVNYVAFRYAVEWKHPLVHTLVSEVSREETQKTQSFLQDNLNAMAVRLGEMQAQLVRIDSLGDRLAKLAGFKPQEFLFDQQPARGGAAPSLPPGQLSLGDFSRYIDFLSRQLDDRSDKLGILDSLLTLDSAKKKLLPSVLPVNGGSYTSNFGWRLDPFTGHNAFHEGIDFIADSGTPIVAAAGGVVVFAGQHPQYGNMVEIDHGNQIVTRYAHASKLLVREGDVILRGAKIAEVGATGRATGTHLHFEVRQNGAPQNPARFLQLPG